MSKHTPGKWVVRTWSDDWPILVGVEGDYADSNDFMSVGVISHHSLISRDEALANARLISAAPEMLDALKIAEAILSNCPDFSTTNQGRIPVTKMSEARAIVRAALSKAGGQTNVE